MHNAFDQLMLYFEATASFGIAAYFLSHNTHQVPFHYSFRRIVMKSSGSVWNLDPCSNLLNSWPQIPKIFWFLCMTCFAHLSGRSNPLFVSRDGSIHIHFSCSIEWVHTCVDGLNACKCLDKYTMKNDFTDEMAARNAKHPGTSKGIHLLDGWPP